MLPLLPMAAADSNCARASSVRPRRDRAVARWLAIHARCSASVGAASGLAGVASNRSARASAALLSPTDSSARVRSTETCDTVGGVLDCSRNVCSCACAASSTSNGSASRSISASKRWSLRRRTSMSGEMMRAMVAAALSGWLLRTWDSASSYHRSLAPSGFGCQLLSNKACSNTSRETDAGSALRTTCVTKRVWSSSSCHFRRKPTIAIAAES